MSSQNGGNEQEFVHLTPESDTNAKNDKQPKKMKPLTAFVQIVFGGPSNGQEVKLSQKCSTVAEHAAFILEKINQSQGSVVGLQLNGPVAIASVLEGNVALIDYDVPLEVDCKYTFRYKLAKVQEELMDGNVPDTVEKMEKQMAKLVEEQTKQWGQMDRMKIEKDTLKKRVEEQRKKWKKHQKTLEWAEAKLKEEQQMASIAEYASQIVVPIVTNLKPHYDRKKLLLLLEHGTMPSIYIQSNQRLNDPGLLQSIVDLLATAEKPAQLVGEVTIETYAVCFAWPKREELEWKGKKPNVAITFDEASASSQTIPGYHLAEYELTNRECRFQVLIHYWGESWFNKLVYKFIYRRLP